MIDKEKYRIFCKNHPDMPIFSKDWWLDTVCETGKWNAILYQNKDKILGSYPFFLKKKKLF